MISIVHFSKSALIDTSNWSSIWDMTLTLKQACYHNSGREKGILRTRFLINDSRCRRTFRHFMNLLNREVYGAAVRHHDKRLRVIPVLEREMGGRWHYHAAVEPPSYLESSAFEKLIHDCWSRTDWGHGNVLVREAADRKWINYMLKHWQKSGLESWEDCIDWESLNNSQTVDA